MSNSSSSSFIVVFDIIPHTLEEVEDLLFADITLPKDATFTKYDLAKAVCDQILFQTPATLKQVIEELEVGWIYPPFDPDNPSIPDIDFEEYLDKFAAIEKLKDEAQKNDLIIQFQKDLKEHEAFKKSFNVEEDDYLSNNSYDWQAHQKACRENAQKIARKWWRKFGDKTIMRFEFSDNDYSGIEDFLEHEGTFGSLPHIQISHH